MATQSIEFTRRQMDRAKQTAIKAQAAPDGEMVPMKALAPELLARCDDFVAADSAARDAEAAAGREVKEGSAAVGDLRQLYDQAKEVVAVKVGIQYDAASTFNTPDDFLNAAEDLENTLRSADPEWAGSLLSTFSAALDLAGKEYSEGSAALKALQKAALLRDEMAGTARPVLVRFRRLVRATYGKSSREYRELLDRQTRRGAPEDPATDPGTAS